MARHKDVDWNLPTNLASWEQAHITVLMDIRDELKQLNRTLSCRNFLDLPRVMQQVRANTTTIARLLKEQGLKK